MTYPSFRNLSFASSEEQNAFLTIKTPPLLRTEAVLLPEWLFYSICFAQHSQLKVIIQLSV